MPPEMHVEGQARNRAMQTIVPLDNIINFRDVGDTMNKLLGEKRMVVGRIYRSARPDDATQSDRRRLREEFGIRSIMDLRTKTEHENQAKKRRADIANPTMLAENAALTEPMKIPGMQYFQININGKGFERKLFWQLGWWSIIKLVILLMLSRRNEAISILGRQVMQPRGLIGLGQDSLDVCGPEIAQSMRAFANTANTPILVHCTQGKDRTGLVVLLLCLLVLSPTSQDTQQSHVEGRAKDLDGAPATSKGTGSDESSFYSDNPDSNTLPNNYIIDAISQDYLLSGPALAVERESRLKEIRAIGLSDDFADCSADWVRRMATYLDEQYGGAERYLGKIGLDKAEIASIKEVLCY